MDGTFWEHTARLGRSFGLSKEMLTVMADDVDLIPDVEIFTSGTHYVCFRWNWQDFI